MRDQTSTISTTIGADDTFDQPELGATPFWQRVAVFLGWLALLYLVYGQVHILFSRNENCWLEMDVQEGMPGIFAKLRFAFTNSYNGHYTPLFFCLELAYTALFGISEAWWRFSQLFMLALLAVALMELFDLPAQQISHRRTIRFWVSFGLTAPFIFSPLIIDFEGWPFESGQVLWAALTVASVTWASKAILESKDGKVSMRALSISFALGYGSLHILGLGVSTMAGWFAVWFVLLFDAFQRKLPAAYLQRLGVVGGIGMVVTIAHGSLMFLLLQKPAVPPPYAALGFRHFIFQSLGYTSNLLVDSLRALWGADGWPYPHGEFLPQDWAYGLGAILLLATCGSFWFLSHRARPAPTTLCRVCWLIFSFASFCMYVLMVGVRILKGEGPWMNFLLGPRYLWVAALLLFGAISSFASLLRLRDVRLTALLSLLLAGSCISGNLVYQYRVVPKVWPLATLSHEKTWRELASMTHELNKAGLPIPDLSLGVMCAEFNPSMQRFDPMLRALAGIGANARLSWLEPSQITPDIWSDMKSKSPALIALTHRVFADDDAALSRPPAPSPDERPNAASDVSLTDDATLKNAVVDHVKDQPNLGVFITANRITKKSIWIDPPTRLTYRNVPIGPHASLRVFVAIHPLVDHEAKADGATFQVDVGTNGQTERVAELYINPIMHPELRGWNLLSVDLSKYAGKTVDLVFSNSPGPANNDYADWCIWGDPRLTEENFSSSNR